MTWRGFTSALALLCAASVTQAGIPKTASIIYVDDDARAGGDGSSWTTAFTFLADAIQFAAVPAHAVSEIRVGQGMYKPDRSQANPRGSRDRAAHFGLVSGVALRGGFLGVAAKPGEDPNQNNPGLYETILSGDLAGDDGPGDFENSSENAFQVVTAVDASETTSIEGFIIQGGHADGPAFGATPLSKDQGSGLNIYFGGLHVEHCVFRGNWNKNHGAVNDHGNTTRVSYCTFVNNYADSFGAGLAWAYKNLVGNSCARGDYAQAEVLSAAAAASFEAARLRLGFAQHA